MSSDYASVAFPLKKITHALVFGSASLTSTSKRPPHYPHQVESNKKRQVILRGMHQKHTSSVALPIPSPLQSEGKSMMTPEKPSQSLEETEQATRSLVDSIWKWQKNTVKVTKYTEPTGDGKASFLLDEVSTRVLDVPFHLDPSFDSSGERRLHICDDDMKIISEEVWKNKKINDFKIADMWLDEKKGTLAAKLQVSKWGATHTKEIKMIREDTPMK